MALSILPNGWKISARVAFVLDHYGYTHDHDTRDTYVIMNSRNKVKWVFFPTHGSGYHPGINAYIEDEFLKICSWERRPDTLSVGP